jgi:hypothetical protein
MTVRLRPELEAQTDAGFRLVMEGGAGLMVKVDAGDHPPP